MATRKKSTTPKPKTVASINGITPSETALVSLPSLPAELNIATIAAAVDFAQRHIAPIVAKIPTDVVTPDDFSTADACLGEIRDAIKAVEEKLEPYIRPYYEFLEGMYAIRRTLQGPLINGEKSVKELMRLWQVMENHRLEEEARLRREKEAAETRRVQAAIEAERELEILTMETEAEALRESGQSGAADAMANHLAEAVMAASIAPAVTVAIATVPTGPPLRTPHSTSSKVRKWRITDRQLFLECYITQLIPESVDGLPLLEINASAINKAMLGEGWKAVDRWPGLEVYEDVRIAGRG